MVLGVALALAAAAVSVPAPVAAGTTVCVKSGRVATVTMTGAGTTVIGRAAAGQLLVDGSPCGAATVTNIDKIRVYGDSTSQQVWLQLANGGFRPGFTNETGSSDEIEIYLYLGSGAADGIRIYGTGSTDDIRLGYYQASSAYHPRVNLNAGETSGIDADLYSTGDLGVFVVAGSGADKVWATGGVGTGDPYQLGVKIEGLGGGDDLRGGDGPDYFIGGTGPDTLRGGAGADDLEVDDGVSGNDTVNGGPDSDFCSFDAGDTVTSCETS